ATRPPKIIHGKVVLDGQTPVLDAQMHLFKLKKEKMLETTMSDQQGDFTFLVKPGDYFLVTEKEGFEKVRSETITVTSRLKTVYEVLVNLISSTYPQNHG